MKQSPSSNRLILIAMPCMAAMSFSALAGDDWQVSMGAGASYAPRYEGAANDRLRLVPLLDVNYNKGKFFISVTRGLGFNFSDSKNIQYGMRVLLGRSRSQSEDPRLYGTGNIDYFAEAGLFLSARLGLLSFSSGAATGEHGTHADVGCSFNIPLGKTNRFRLGVNQNWGDANYNQTYFGVTAVQATASGNVLTVYDAGEGVKDTTISATWVHNYDDNWAGTINLTHKRLQGYAEASPLTQRVNADSISYLLGYRF